MYKRLKIWQKLMLIVLLMGVPTGVLVFLFVRSQDTQIEFAAKEVQGVEYLRAARSLLERLPQYRSSAASSLAPLIDADLRALEAVDQRLGKDLNTTELVQVLRRDWTALRDGATVADGDVSRLVTDLLGVVRRAGDNSNLILDPDLDTYYLMDGVVVRLPKIIENLALTLRLEAPDAGSLSAESRARLTVLNSQIRTDLGDVQRGFTVAYGYNTGLESKLEPVFAASAGAIDVYLRQLASRTAQPESSLSPSTAPSGSGTAAPQGLLRLYDAALANLDELLRIRIGHLKSARNTQLGSVAAILLLAVLAAILVTLAILRQIRVLNELFAKIGQGDYTARARVLSLDEMGGMAGSLNAMLDTTLALVQSRDERDRLQLSIRKLLEEISGVADGDLTREAEVSAEATGAIADSFNFMISQLRTVIGNVQDITAQVGSAANEIQVTTEHLAHGSETQTSQIVDTSAAVDEIAVSIQQVAESTVTAASVADEALTSARRGTEVVDRTISGMEGIRQHVQETAKRIKRLGEGSQEIGEIVQLIGDIADRTSILALNASIQAAMAGEAGRGFAVVAEEVERLAERSADATKRIATLIKTIQGETTEAVGAMEETTREVVGGSRLAQEAGQSLQVIGAVSQRLAELIQSINLATKQQARGSESVAKSMGEISSVTHQTAAGTKQAAVALRSLANLAENLRESVSAFRLPKRAA